MKAKSALIAFLLFLFYFSFVKSSFAAFSLNISSITPDSVSYNEQEVTVNVSISGLPSESYFRIAWQESSGKPYFGYMKDNNGDWVRIESSQDCKNYYKVSDTGTASLTLITKIGEENTINNGLYLLKARRYTASCSSYTDSDPFSIQINLPTPTPTNVPNSPTLTNTPTPKPTNSPTPTPKPTVTPTIIKTISKTPASNAANATPTIISSEIKDVLGNSTKSSVDKFEEPKKENKKEKLQENNNLLPIIFISIGVVFLLACVIVFLYPNIKDYLNKQNE